MARGKEALKRLRLACFTHITVCDTVVLHRLVFLRPVSIVTHRSSEAHFGRCAWVHPHAVIVVRNALALWLGRTSTSHTTMELKVCKSMFDVIEAAYCCSSFQLVAGKQRLDRSFVRCFWKAP